MKSSIGSFLLGLSLITAPLFGQTVTDTFTSAPGTAPYPWGPESVTHDGSGTLWYANARFEYTTTGALAIPLKDGVDRQLTTYFGTQSADWTISVDTSLTVTLSGTTALETQMAALSLNLSAPGNYLSVGNGTNYAGNQFFYATGGTPTFIGTPSGTGNIKITYTAASTTLNVFLNGSASSAYSVSIGSWFTGHPEYTIGLALGASSYSNSVNYSSPAIASGQAYFDNFTADGAGLQSSAVPEPSTYAALMGLGVIGFAAIRRRRMGKIKG